MTSTRSASDLAQRAYFLKESDEFQFEIDVFGRKIGRKIQLSQVPFTPKKQTKPLKHNRKWKKMNYNGTTAGASSTEVEEETYIHEIKEEEDIPTITTQVDHLNTDATVEGQLVGSQDMAQIVNPNTGAVSTSPPKPQRRSKKDVVSSDEAVQKKARGRKPRAQLSVVTVNEVTTSNVDNHT